MTQSDIGIVEKLKACRRCGTDCRIQIFPANGALKTDTMLWMCANSSRLGGQCDEDAYLTAEAWNTRDPIITEMVEALEACDRIVLEQRCERGTPWDLACTTIAKKIREHVDTTLAKVRGK